MRILMERNWMTGEGVKPTPLKAHDREVLCLDINGTELVTGSCDHALHLYDLRSMSLKRRLFTPKFGHHEWVSCCAYACDGRVISGGMDSVICVWDKTSPRCTDLTEHQYKTT